MQVSFSGHVTKGPESELGANGYLMPSTLSTKLVLNTPIPQMKRTEYDVYMSLFSLRMQVHGLS